MKVLLPLVRDIDAHVVEAASNLGIETHVMCNSHDINQLDSTRVALRADVWNAVPSMYMMQKRYDEYAKWYGGIIEDYVIRHDISAVIPTSSTDQIRKQIFSANVMLGLHEHIDEGVAESVALGFSPDLPKDKLGLFETMELLSEKADYLPFFESKGIKIPKIYEIVNPGEKSEYYGIKFPCINKPSRGRGGQGIFISDSRERHNWFYGPSDPESKFTRIGSFYRDRIGKEYRNYIYYSDGGRYIVQEYMKLPCVSIAGTACGGKLRTDLVYLIQVTKPPYCSEVRFSYPVFQQEHIEELAEQLVKKIESQITLPDGAFMIDTLCDGQDLHVVDFGARLSSSATKLMHHVTGSEKYTEGVVHSLVHGKLIDNGNPYTKHRCVDYIIPEIKKGVDTSQLKYPNPSDFKQSGSGVHEVKKTDKKLLEPRNDIQTSDRGYILSTGTNIKETRDITDRYIKVFQDINKELLENN